MRSLSRRARLAIRALLGCTIGCAVGCGDGTGESTTAIWLSSDNTHPCAGAVEVQINIDRTDGETLEARLPAAVGPEQLECNFDAGVAEAYFGVLVGEIDVGVPYITRIRMLDSTGLVVGAGSSEPFRAGDAIDVELTRTAPLGTALVDLNLLDALVERAGTVDVVVLAGTTAVGQREVDWSSDDATKRPLRISGLAGTGLRLSLEMDDGSSTVSFVSDVFSLGSSSADAFAQPKILQID